MSRSLSALLTITLLFAGGYFWYLTESICPIPLEYRMGIISAEFDIDTETARTAMEDAEALWEEAAGMNLFEYNEEARFAINFVFDERQQFTNAEEYLSQELDEAKQVNEEVEGKYNDMVARYDALTIQYEQRQVAYEVALNDYNQEVSEWNEKGGAPQEVFDQLNSTKEALDVEQNSLLSLRGNLNQLVGEINSLSEQANTIVESYNRGVAAYNQTFTEGAEFTQGDYQGTHINIYQFTDLEELTLVLAHEFGHALGIEHVDNPESIMYLKMGEQELNLGVSNEDLEAFVGVCGDGSRLSKISRLWNW